MVAVHHAQHDAVVVAQRGGATFAPSSLLPWMAGVDIFFVVSGFIMVHASRDLPEGREGARLFLGRRLARIVPLYWAATTLFLLTALALPTALNSGTPGPWQIVSAYLFWPSVSTVGLIQPVYSLGWTLNYEMLFYALFAAGLLLPRALGAATVTLALAGLVGAEALAGPLPLPLSFWGQPIVLEFAAGMAIAALRGRGLSLGTGPRLGLVALGVAVLLVAAQAPELSGSWSTTVWRGSAATLLVLAAACGPPRSEEPLVPLQALAAVGDASYALYLVHPFVIRGLREIMVRLGFGWPLLFMVLALAASVAAALLVHLLFEKPATRLARGWLRA